MSKLFRGRRNHFGAGALSLALVTLVVVVAARTDGYRADHVDLNDASVWISGTDISSLGPDQSAQIGRVNTELHKINFQVPVSDATLYQDGDTTLFLQGSSLTSVDGATQATHAGSVAENAAVAVGGGTGAVLDSKGELWVAPVDSLATLPKGSTPQAKVDPGSLLVVGNDGVAYTYAPGQKQGYAVSLNGSQHRWSLPQASSKESTSHIVDAATESADVELSVVGSTPVVLDRAHRQVLVSGGSAVSISDTYAELQQPGPADDVVQVATGSGLLAVGLRGGKSHLERRATANSPDPARPVVVQGCAYAAWGSNWLIRYCAGEPQFDFSAEVSDDMSTGADLVFRVNHDRVVLNDPKYGDAWVVPQRGSPVQVTGWQKSEKQTTKNKKQTNVELPHPERDCNADKNVKLEAPAVTIGARVGIPTSLTLGQINHLQVPHCHVIEITDVSLDASKGVAQVSGPGDAVQFTMQHAGTATAKYYISEGASPVHGTITIDVHPMNETNDKPPNPNDDRRTSTFAVAGQTTSYNALKVATDPEGDPISLVDACVGPTSCLHESPGERSSTDGTVQFQPDGWIRYTAPQTVKGSQTLSFRLADQWGKTADDSVDVTIQNADKVAPVTHDDRVRAIQGQVTKVDVLGNDVSPAGNPLKLSSFSIKSEKGMSTAQAKAAVQRYGDDGNELAVNADAPLGWILVEYEAGDGTGEPSQGYARIHVTKAADRPTPVAMMDTAVARAKAQVMVDVTDNDFDDAGSVLVVQSLQVEKGGGTAQIMGDAHDVRITAPDGFDRGSTPMIVRYTVSNGYHSSIGTLVVSPYASYQDLSPFTQDDGPVTLRAGMMTSIPVLANDVDPEGASLYLQSVKVVGKDQGHAFVEGDDVRYVAPSGHGRTGPVKLTYTVSDEPPGEKGNMSSGFVDIQVLPANVKNKPPKPLNLTARAVQGRTTHISVPLLSADPDGDIVGIAGVSDAPTKGKAVVTGDGFDYTPGTGDADVGTDTFTFRLSDGKLSTDSTVRVGVVGPTPSRGPVATPIKVVVRPGQSRQIDLLSPTSVTSTAGSLRVQRTGNKKDKPRLVTPDMGSIGKVSVDGIVTYHAPANVGEKAKSASLYYVVQDSGGTASNVVIITVDRDAKLQAPSPKDDFVKPTRKGEKVHVDLLANDTDPGGASAQDLKVDLIGAPEFVSRHGGTVSFEMPGHGVRFRYRVTSPVTKQTAQAIVSVPLNTGLACTPRTIDIGTGQSRKVDMAAQCSAPPGKKVHLSDSPRLDGDVGTAQVRDGKVDVAVSKSAKGGDYPLVATVCVEGTECTNTLTTVSDTLRVTGNDDSPTLTDNVSVPADGQATVNLSDVVRDPNPGDAAKVRFSHVDPVSGSGVKAELSGRMLTLNADLSARGNTVKFHVDLDDGHGKGGQGTGTITVKVTDSHLNIRAVDDTETVINPAIPPHETWHVLENDVALKRDGSRADLKVASVSQAAGRHGTTKNNGDSVTFTPHEGFGGGTSFSYTAESPDSGARTSTATVSIHVVGLPAQPLAPQGRDKLNGQVTLAWVAPSANGGPIDHYTVACEQASGGSCPTASMQTTGTTLTYTGLHNDVGYKFQVRAHNQAGYGQPSAWSSTWTPDQVPAPPQITQVGLFDGTCSNGGNCDAAGADGVGGQLTVKWAQPDFEGSRVTAYTVHVTGGSGSGNFSVGGGQHSRVVSGLANGTQYSFSVTATNNKGESPPSANASGTTMTTPGQVSVINVSNNTAQELAVTWGAANPNGDKPGNVQYKITTSPVAGGSGTETSGTGARITGATPGQTYTVTVSARNGAGWGPGQSTTGKPGAQPGIVTGLTATPGNNSVQFSFSNPSDTGGYTIDHYRVSTDGGGTWSTLNSTGPGTGTVAATNGDRIGPFLVEVCTAWTGQHPCSDPSNQAGAVTPFGPPTNLSVRGQWVGSKIKWSWSSDRGAGADGVAWSLSGGGVSGSGTGTGGSATTGDFGCAAVGSETLAVSFWSTQGPTNTSDTVQSSGTVAGKPDTCDVTTTTTAPIDEGHDAGPTRNDDGSTNANYIDRLPSGSTVTIACQASGPEYSLSDRPPYSPPYATIWDRESNGRWLPDYWVNTQGDASTGTFDRRLPRC